MPSPVAALKRAAAGWPPLAKLGGLAGLGLALFLTASPPVLGMAAALCLAAALALTGARACREATSFGLVVIVLAVAAAASLSEGLGAGAASLFRMVSLLAAAHLVTATTRASDMEDALVAALRPFERLPFVSAASAGLAISLALRSVPRLRAAARDIRDAHAARGLRVSPVRLLVPLLARTLRDADTLSDAIEARGWTGRTPR